MLEIGGNIVPNQRYHGGNRRITVVLVTSWVQLKHLNQRRNKIACVLKVKKVELIKISFAIGN